MILQNSQNNRRVSYLYLGQSFTPINLNCTLANRIKRLINPKKIKKVLIQEKTLSPLAKTFFDHRSKSVQQTNHNFKMKVKKNLSDANIDNKKRTLITQHQRKRQSLIKRKQLETLQLTERQQSPYKKQIQRNYRSLIPKKNSQYISIVCKKQIQTASTTRNRRKRPSINLNLKKRQNVMVNKSIRQNTQIQVRPWSAFKGDQI